MQIGNIRNNPYAPIKKSPPVRTERSDSGRKNTIKDRRKGDRRQQRQQQRGFEMRTGGDRRRGNIDISL